MKRKLLLLIMLFTMVLMIAPAQADARTKADTKARNELIEAQKTGFFGAFEVTDIITSEKGTSTLGRGVYFGMYHKVANGVYLAAASSYGETTLNNGLSYNEWQAKSVAIIDVHSFGSDEWTFFLITEAGESFRNFGNGLLKVNNFMAGIGGGLRKNDKANTKFFETASFWWRVTLTDNHQAVHIGLAFTVPLLINK